MDGWMEFASVSDLIGKMYQQSLLLASPIHRLLAELSAVKHAQ